MMELSLDATGTQLTTSLFPAVKIANIEFGINMEDNFTTLPFMITLLPALSGHQTVITSLLALSKC